MGIKEIKGPRRQRRKVTYSCANCRPTARRIRKGSPTKCWLVLAATVMTLRARPGDSTVFGPGPLVAGSHSYGQTCIDRVIESDRQQIVITMVSCRQVID